MKKLIDLFNKKYGSLYGVIDDSIDNEDVYKVYKVIKTLCADDEEIMTLLEKVKLPNPKTAKESIEKINAEHVNGGGGGASPFNYELKTVCENVTPNVKGKFSTVDNFISTYKLEKHNKIEIGLEMTDDDGTTQEVYYSSDEFYDGYYSSYRGEGAYRIESKYSYNEDDTLTKEPLYMYLYDDKSLGMAIYDKEWHQQIVTKILYIRQYNSVNTIGDRELGQVDFTNIENLPTEFSRLKNANASTLLPNMAHALQYKNILPKTLFTMNDFKNTPFEGVTPKLSEPLNGIYHYCVSISNVYQEDGRNSVGIKFSIDKAGYHEILITNISNGYVTLTDNLGNVLREVKTRENIKSCSYNFAVGEYYLLFAKRNSNVSDVNIPLNNGVVIYRSSADEGVNNLSDIAYKEYVDEMSPFSLLENEILYDNITLTWDEGSYAYTTNLDTYDFNKDYAYDIYLKNSEGNEIFISNKMLDGMPEEDSITYYNNENPIADGIVQLQFYIDSVYKDARVCAYDMNWNDITNLVSAKIIKIKYNKISDKQISKINYKQIEDVPYELRMLVDGVYHSLTLDDYFQLKFEKTKNLEINKANYNESPYSTAKKNNVWRTDWSNFMRVYTKYSEGVEKASGYKLSSLKKGSYYITNFKNANHYYIDVVASKDGVNTVLKTIDTYKASLGYTSFYVPNDDTDIYILYRITDESNREDVYVLPNLYLINPKKLEYLIQRDNIIPYEPTDDYNPATKKYVDDKTASLNFTINNNLPSNETLTLTTNKFQTTTLATPTEIQLPEVTEYTEIHLFFTGVSGVIINTPATVKWKNTATIEDGKTYEVTFTYINDVIGWLADIATYSTL